MIFFKELGISNYLGGALINNNIVIRCGRGQQYYLGSIEDIPSSILKGSKCIVLTCPHVRSEFNYQKDYKLATPSILYSILHEINDYKILTIPLEPLSGGNKISRIVISPRAQIQQYVRKFTSLGFCVHAMCDIWQAMLNAACQVLPEEKSAWVIAAAYEKIYVFYFKNNNIYLHLQFDSGELEKSLIAIDEFRKDFVDISTDVWHLDRLPTEVASSLTARGLVLRDLPFEGGFELFCCMGAQHA